MKFHKLECDTVKKQEKRLEKTKKELRTRQIELEKLRHKAALVSIFTNNHHVSTDTTPLTRHYIPPPTREAKNNLEYEGRRSSDHEVFQLVTNKATEKNNHCIPSKVKVTSVDSHRVSRDTTPLTRHSIPPPTREAKKNLEYEGRRRYDREKFQSVTKKTPEKNNHCVPSKSKVASLFRCDILEALNFNCGRKYDFGSDTSYSYSTESSGINFDCILNPTNSSDIVEQQKIVSETTTTEQQTIVSDITTDSTRCSYESTASSHSGRYAATDEGKNKEKKTPNRMNLCVQPNVRHNQRVRQREIMKKDQIQRKLDRTSNELNKLHAKQMKLKVAARRTLHGC
jgi:hypothetical protein